MKNKQDADMKEILRKLLTGMDRILPDLNEKQRRKFFAIRAQICEEYGGAGFKVEVAPLSDLSQDVVSKGLKERRDDRASPENRNADPAEGAKRRAKNT